MGLKLTLCMVPILILEIKYRFRFGFRLLTVYRRYIGTVHWNVVIYISFRKLQRTLSLSIGCCWQYNLWILQVQLLESKTYAALSNLPRARYVNSHVKNNELCDVLELTEP